MDYSQVGLVLQMYVITMYRIVVRWRDQEIYAI